MDTIVLFHDSDSHWVGFGPGGFSQQTEVWETHLKSVRLKWVLQENDPSVRMNLLEPAGAGLSELPRGPETPAHTQTHTRAHKPTYQMLLLQVLICRNYRGEVDMNHVDRFIGLYRDLEEDNKVAPILQDGVVTFVHIKYRDLFRILATDTRAHTQRFKHTHTHTHTHTTVQTHAHSSVY